MLGIADVGVRAQGFSELGPVAPMQVARYGHMATPLDDGKVLVAGGHTQGFALTATAEIYDPALDTWTLYNVPNPHDGGAMVRLSDGRYLFMGGASSGSGVGQSSVTTLYDPVSDSFTNGPPMLYSRFFQTAAVLASGDVLVVGNWYAPGTAELYDHSSGTFVPVGMPIERSSPLILPCADGTAYIVGGSSIYGSGNFTEVEAFDPATGQFALVASEMVPGEQGWSTYWSSYMNRIDLMQRTNGHYVFLVYRVVAGEYEYGIAEFDPVAKQFSLLPLDPALPIYTGTTAGPWAYAVTLMLDQARDLVHVSAVDLVDPLHAERMHTVDVPTGFVSLATGGVVFGRYLYSGSRAWIGDAILFTGGTVDGSNFNVSNEANLLLPQHTVSIGSPEEPVEVPFAYPDPMGPDGGWVHLRGKGQRLLRLIDQTGRICREIGVGPSEEMVRIERAGLPAGMYTIELTGPQYRSTCRVVLE
ncbi:MAG: hypothetical protein GFGODING_03029 [Flavobacteriales bacterium]|nr:hypothetical protein [Flavobacteriales bacterium]NUQ16117.1 hypothetical protein [Flavobacteriales bacterium]